MGRPPDAPKDPGGAPKSFRQKKRVVSIFSPPGQGGLDALSVVVPYNAEAEESALGACLISATALAQVKETVGPSDFYKPEHAEVFRAILAVAERDGPVDAVTVAQELRRGGILEKVGGRPLLHTLVASVPSPGGARSYAGTVRQDSLRRQLLEFSQTLGHAAAVAELPETAALMRNFSDQVDRRLAEDDGASGPLRGCTAAELLEMEFPEKDWVVPGFVPQGLVLVAGKPKVGKSWLGLGLAVAVASGGRALGRVALSTPAGALYLALEDNPRRLKKRLAQILHGDPAPRRLRLEWEWPKLDEGGLDRIRLWLEQHQGTQLVVVDTLQKIRGGPRSGGNLYAEDYEALGALKTLADRHEAAVMVMHHLRKPEGGDALDQVLGTTGMTGVPDTIFTLKRERSRADAVLYVTGRDVEEAEWALRFDPGTASWSVLGDAGDFRRSEERQAVLDVLARAQDPMGPKEIAESLDRTIGSTKMLLGEMVKSGELARLGYGKYGLGTVVRPDSADAPDLTDSPYSADSGSRVRESAVSAGFVPLFPDASSALTSTTDDDRARAAHRASSMADEQRRDARARPTDEPEQARVPLVLETRRARAATEQTPPTGPPDYAARARPPVSQSGNHANGAGRARAAQTTDARRLVLGVLEDLGVPASAEEVAAALGRSVPTTRGLLWRMAKSGELETPARGRFGILGR